MRARRHKSNVIEQSREMMEEMKMTPEEILLKDIPIDIRNTFIYNTENRENRENKEDTNEIRTTDPNTFTIENNKVILNEEQKKVVYENIDSNIRIVAAAGSGKTTTILCRMKYLTDNNISETNILCLTFNVDSSVSLRRKIKDIYGKIPKITINTLDAFAYKYHKHSNSTHFIGVCEYSTLLVEFLKTKEGKKVLDQYKYIFFDEFQDVNNIQYEVIMMFYKNGSKITVIGDDSQNIYQWRGSNIDYILNLDKYIPDLITHKLEQNYRSTPEIIEFANNSIKNNTDQIPKRLIATKESKNKKPLVIQKVKDDMLINYIIDQIIQSRKNGSKYDDIAILARNNFLLKIVEEGLARYNSKNKFSAINFVSLISDNTADTKPIVLPDHITLTTIHRAKGLEWDKVILIGCDDRYIPSELDNISIQEDRRLFYVAITRAKTDLIIIFKYIVSRFVHEIDRNLYLFPGMKPLHFKYNNERGMKFKCGVTELISLLDQNDIARLRKAHIIPETNIFERIVNTPNKLDHYVEKYNLNVDYGLYIDRYISHYIGSINSKSNGLFDMTAESVINSIQLNKPELSVYNRYYYNIITKLNIHNPTLLSINKEPTDCEYVKHINTKDEKILYRVIQLISKKCIECEIVPIEVQAIQEAYLSDEFNSMMNRSYKTFQETNEELEEHKIDEIELNRAIYQVSLCGSIIDQRRRLLYLDVFDNFNSCKKIYTDIKNWCDSYKDKKIITKYLVSDDIRIIKGEIDLYDRSDKTIIDFKTSSTPFKLEWLLQLLTYTALLRQADKVINFIMVYNPLLGKEYKIDVSNWDKGEQLLEELNNIRKQSYIKNTYD